MNARLPAYDFASSFFGLSESSQDTNRAPRSSACHIVIGSPGEQEGQPPSIITIIQPAGIRKRAGISMLSLS